MFSLQMQALKCSAVLFYLLREGVDLCALSEGSSQNNEVKRGFVSSLSFTQIALLVFNPVPYLQKRGQNTAYITERTCNLTNNIPYSQKHGAIFTC